MKKPLILAYAFKDSIFSITPDDAGRLTHVNLAFGHVGKDGLLDSRLMDQFIDYIEVIRKWNPEIKFVMSIGGWGAGGFSNMALTEEGREAFSASCAKYTFDHNLDGVDIDWEYPCNNSAGIDADPRDRENFTFLLESLRKHLGKDKILSIAAGGGDYFVRDTEMDKVAKICDYVQLMTYDLRSGFCSEAGHHTSLYTTEGDESRLSVKGVVDMFTEAGVPHEKIVIGAAFYSRRWKDVPNVNNGMLQHAGTIGNYGAGYSDLVAHFIDKNGFVRYWDEKAKAPYLFNGSEFISYDDPLSIQEKCRYLLKEDLLGIMYWDHGSDHTHTLLKAMYDSLR